MTRVAFYTDIGLRDSIEDRAKTLMIQDATSEPTEVAVLVVADGAGGRAGGEIASELAVRTVLPLVVSDLAGLSSQELGINLAPDTVEDVLTQALVCANDVVVEKAQCSPALEGMASTVVCSVIIGYRIHVAWAGDSRCYLFSDGGLQRLTRDHSGIQELLDLGLVRPEDARLHPLAHTIRRYLGQPDDFRPELSTGRIRPGDIVLQCTDGLTDVLTDDEIAGYVKGCQGGDLPFDRLPVYLVDAALAAGTTDNVTVLCCEWRPAAALGVSTFADTLTGAYPVAVAAAHFTEKKE